MKEISKKKLLILSLVIFLIVSIVGITSLITYAQNAEDKGIQISDASIGEVNISFSQSKYEYIVGDRIEITPEISIEGLIEEGDHPDKVLYQWYVVSGGRPSPLTLMDKQTEKTLEIEKAQLTDTHSYHLNFYIERYNSETGEYEEIKEGKQTKSFWSKSIEVIVLPEINIDLKKESGSKIKGNKTDGYSLGLDIGETYKLDVDLYRQNEQTKIPPEQVKALTWKSSNSAAVEVADDGNLTVKGHSDTPVRITATVTDINSKDKSVFIDVTVKKVPVNNIEIHGEDGENIQEINLEVDEHVTLTAVVSPEDASWPIVTWKIKDGQPVDIATINEDTGEVIGKTIGRTIVEATADSASKECIVNVVKTPVKSIEDGLQSTDIQLWENADGSSEDKHTLTITPEVLPKNATNKEITWQTSDPAVANVVKNEDGTVSFVAGVYDANKHTCTITASADEGAITRTYNITVLDHYIAINPENGVTIEPAGTEVKPIKLTVGDTKAFSFTVTPENATYEMEDWTVTAPDGTSSTNVITVDESGVVTAEREGSAYVRISIKCQEPNCPKHVAKAYIKVEPKPVINVESIRIKEGDRVTLRKNDTITLTAEVTPENAENKTVTWESHNTKVATVDRATGKVTALAPGEAVIEATAGGQSDTCTVVVTPIKVERLDISDVSLTVKDNLVVGEKKLTVSYYPADADNKAVDWSSDDPTIVEIKSDGSIVPKKTGTTIVRATVHDDSSVFAACQVTVIPSRAPVVFYTVDQHSNFISGLTLRLTGTDDTGKQIEPKEITANGMFDFGMFSDGSYSIQTILPTAKRISRASDLDIIDYVDICDFQIIDGTLLYEDPNGEEIKAADSLVLVNIVDYPDEEDEDKKSATVGIGSDYEKDGQTILEQYEEYMNTPVESISDELASTNIHLVENTNITIHPEVLPEHAINKKLTWKSSDDTIARVTENNDNSVSFTAGAYVEGKNECTITATAHNGVKREYHITVEKETIAVKNIVITVGETETPTETVELHVGETIHLSFKVEPENATYMEDTWSFEPKDGSSANVISIDNAGLITAKELGEAEVTVTVKCSENNCPGHSKTVLVKVIPIPVEKVEIELEQVDGQKSVTLKEHDKKTLTAIVTPENATDKTVTWESSDPNIVSVDENGNLEALAIGEVTITAKAGDKTDICEITVIASDNSEQPPVEQEGENGGNSENTPGDGDTNTPTVTPGSGSDDNQQSPEHSPESDDKTTNSDDIPQTSDIPIVTFAITMVSCFIAIIFIIFNKNAKLKREE